MTAKYFALLIALLPAVGHGRSFSGPTTLPAETQPPSPRVVQVVAERFAFTPSDISVDEGTVLELRITSEDTDHGFRLHGLGDANVAIPKRGRGDVRVTVDAATAGTYTFECSHVCGAGHGFMRGVIRVKPRPLSR